MRNIWKLYFELMVLNAIYVSKEIFALKSTAIRVPPFVKAGDTVTFTCEYDLEQVPLYSLRWYRNDEEFYRYVPKESPPFKSYAVKYINVDVSKSGENVVTLRGVQRQLTGDYKCEVSADGPLFHTVILVAHMIVAEIPEEIPVMKIEPNKIEIGKKIIAECVSPPSDPAANLTWFINNKEISKKSGSLLHKKNQNSLTRLWTSNSKMEVTVDKSHIVHGLMKVRCKGSIYSLWNGTVEEDLRDETPKLAEILESTSFHGQMDLIIETPPNSGQITAIPSMGFPTCILVSITSYVFKRR